MHMLLFIFIFGLCIFLVGFHSQYEYYPVSNVTNFEDPPRGLVELYTDIHVMVFIGLGFLMIFVRRYSFSTIGFNFILCTFTVEWVLIVRGYLFDWNSSEQIFMMDIKSLVTADFVAVGILISMGAVLGKVNSIQWFVFSANDAGELMYVHTFRAYFGLTIAFVLFRSNVLQSPHKKSSYTSGVFSIIGTLFLFCFWPSFNAATTSSIDRLLAVTNTYVSMSASVAGAFIMSKIIRKDKLDVIHIQNSTLAGGVAVGTVAPSNIGLHGAIIIGNLAGIISVLGFHFLLPKLQSMRVHDTCRVNNLHGMAGITGIIVASIDDQSGYLNHLTDVCLSGGKQRTNDIQSAYQAAALGLTLLMAIVGGLITGLILRLPIFGKKTEDLVDESNWPLPDDELNQRMNVKF